MKERNYKIGEVAELLGIEQYTLRYLESTLGLKIKRNERSDRLYTESDLETLKLVLQLKERGLNTTAIKLALENAEEKEETGIATAGNSLNLNLLEVVSITKSIYEQNSELMEQNRKLEKRMEKLEEKIEKRNLERERKIDDFLSLWKAEQEGKGRSWLSKIWGK
ncbi:MAG: MerR family transcriptional regulator [Syntrophomonadaceae bacterium]|nr:MerR family transcriptional regulator [Syntrophomonadaceae bacterium]MDD3024246.1 MerR family transcriptional regulator [Syntrophomonadaceae bacterium]